MLLKIPVTPEKRGNNRSDVLPEKKNGVLARKKKSKWKIHIIDY